MHSSNSNYAPSQLAPSQHMSLCCIESPMNPERESNVSENYSAVKRNNLVSVRILKFKSHLLRLE